LAFFFKAGKSNGASASASADTSDYAVEYAKSNRSECRGCGNKIDKVIVKNTPHGMYNNQLIVFQDEVRVSKKDYESQRAKMYGPVDLWHHIQCFVDNREELEFGTDMDPTT
jgi:poly [ADP-ribose] polymerase